MQCSFCLVTVVVVAQRQENLVSLILSPQTCRFMRLSDLRDFRNGEAPILQIFLSHTFHQFQRHQGRSATTVFVVHNNSAFSDLPVPSSDHTIAHNVGFIQVAQWAVDLCWRLFLSVQKSDNRTNLAVGVRQYQCSHFLLPLCNNYCRHKTETTLQYHERLEWKVGEFSKGKYLRIFTGCEKQIQDEFDPTESPGHTIPLRPRKLRSIPQGIRHPTR